MSCFVAFVSENEAQTRLCKWRLYATLISQQPSLCQQRVHNDHGFYGVQYAICMP